MLHKYNRLTFRKFCQKSTVYIEGGGIREHWNIRDHLLRELSTQ